MFIIINIISFFVNYSRHYEVYYSGTILSSKYLLLPLYKFTNKHLKPTAMISGSHRIPSHL